VFVDRASDEANTILRRLAQMTTWESIRLISGLRAATDGIIRRQLFEYLLFLTLPWL
jgi:hypothetical protein